MRSGTRACERPLDAWIFSEAVSDERARMGFAAALGCRDADLTAHAL